METIDDALAKVSGELFEQARDIMACIEGMELK